MSDLDNGSSEATERRIESQYKRPEIRDPARIAVELYAAYERGYGSPFKKYREVLFKSYGAAATLRQLVMSLWNGSAYPFETGRIRNLDLEHYSIAMQMLASYAVRGENDKDFLNLGFEIRNFVSLSSEG